MKSMKNTLRSRRGESIAETLVAMLIVALAALMLAGSIVSSATVNSKVKNMGTFSKLSKTGGTTCEIKIDGVKLTEVTIYEDADTEKNGGLMYYD